MISRLENRFPVFLHRSRDITRYRSPTRATNPGRSEPQAESAAEKSEAAVDPPARDLRETVFTESAPMSAPLPEPTEPRRRIDPEKAAELAAILEKSQKSKRTRKTVVDKNQMSIFDFVA